MSCGAIYHSAILMIQLSADPSSRRYWPFDSLYSCMEGLCRVFEEHLKAESGDNSDVITVTYEIADILNFIDMLPDCVCVVKRSSDGNFFPCTKAWIKDKVYVHLYHQTKKNE